MDMITANQEFKCSLADFELLPKRGILARFKKYRLPLSIGLFMAKKPLEAYVNHGRWVVKCECGGAEKAWEEERFMCLSCLNSAHKHQYRVAIFPRNRAQIEGLLSRRPLINRNWYPGESLAQLRRENKEHEGELL